VSRDTRLLRADVILLFRFFQPASGHLATGPDVIAVCWCIGHRAAPHTYGGSLAVATTMAGSYQGVRCDLETDRCPRPVLCTRQDTRATFSREGQARVRSSPREPLTTLTVCAGAGVGVESTLGLRDRAPYAHRRSATPSCGQCRAWMVRFIPGVSREASRAPTPLPEPFKHVGRSTAVCGLTMS